MVKSLPLVKWMGLAYPMGEKSLHKIQSILYWLWSALAGLGLAFVFLWFRGDLRTLEPRLPGTSHTPTSFSAAVQHAAPAVVNIYANKLVTSKRLAHITNPAIQRILGVQGIIVPTQRLERSLGSGVLVREDGLILTNQHVIEGADDIQVLLADGREYAAQIIGVDVDTDLAVLRIPVSDLPYLRLDAPAALDVGDIVLAIGNPFGLSQTVTQGIVSALQRTGSPEAPLARFIQTDAAINEGNSGGALINAQGELVGINVSTLTGVQHIQGISFAIPSNLARQVLQEILQFGHVRRGWLGIEADLNYPALLAQNNALPMGIRVIRVVKGSPAEKAGIRPGDVLRKIDQQQVDARSNILAYIAARKPGSTVSLEWVHQGELKQQRVKLQQRPLQEGHSGSTGSG